MKVGAERNKVIVLAVLSVVAVGTVYQQFFSGDAAPSSPPRPSASAAGQNSGQVARRPAPAATSQRQSPRRGDRFRPSFGSASDAPLDPLEVDPTLRTDVLAKVQSVTFQGVERDLFQFTTRKAKVEPPRPQDVALAQKRLEEAKAEPPPAPAPSAPRAPRITWRYYGFANLAEDSRKRAFLLDGEEVFVATEGDVFKQRYKIVRIGVNSIVVEDMQFSDQQTLPLEAS